MSMKQDKGYCKHIMHRDTNDWAIVCLHVIQGAKIFSDINKNDLLCALCEGVLEERNEDVIKHCKPVCIKCIETFKQNQHRTINYLNPIQ